MKDDDGEKRRNKSTRDFICVEGILKFFKSLLHLFDHMIKPSALYGVEIWGLLTPAMLKKKLELYDLFKDWEYEKLNLKFCKYLLGVNKRSTNIAVLSELGKMPLFISHITAMFTFLHRLENSDSNSLVYHALKESISCTERKYIMH